MNKPSYLKYKDLDWSGQYYAEDLKKYFDLPAHEYNRGHWYGELSFFKYDPRIDVLHFFVKKDMETANSLSCLKTYNMSFFQKRVSFKIFIQRVFLLKKLAKYFELNIKTVREFLTQPVYLNYSFS